MFDFVVHYHVPMYFFYLLSYAVYLWFCNTVRYTCILLFLHCVVSRSQLRTVEIAWPRLLSHCNLCLYICMYVCMYSQYIACMFVCLVDTSVLLLPKIATNCLPRCVGIRFVDRANPPADLLPCSTAAWSASFDVNSHFRGKFAVPRVQGLRDYLAFLLIFLLVHLFSILFPPCPPSCHHLPLLVIRYFHDFWVRSHRARMFWSVSHVYLPLPK